MKTVAKFEKVSYEQFKKDWLDSCVSQHIDATDEEKIKEIYDNIKLPKRATTMSAGYDVFAPYTFKVPINGATKIPTGIRCYIRDGWVLNLYPRSGQGFKYGIHLANSVGIIDAG